MKNLESFGKLTEVTSCGQKFYTYRNVSENKIMLNFTTTNDGGHSFESLTIDHLQTQLNEAKRIGVTLCLQGHYYSFHKAGKEYLEALEHLMAAGLEVFGFSTLYKAGTKFKTCPKKLNGLDKSLFYLCELGVKAAKMQSKLGQLGGVKNLKMLKEAIELDLFRAGDCCDLTPTLINYGRLARYEAAGLLDLDLMRSHGTKIMILPGEGLKELDACLKYNLPFDEKSETYQKLLVQKTLVSIGD